MQKGRFITGFVLGALLCGTAVVFSAIGNYTPKPDGDWIRDVTKYVPGTDDQINVLADIQPGGGVLMMEVGLRVNALYFAGKKKNWDLAAYEMHELTEALEKLEITRPAMAGFLGSFLAGPEVASVNGQVGVQDGDTGHDERVHELPHELRQTVPGHQARQVGPAAQVVLSCHAAGGAPVPPAACVSGYGARKSIGVKLV